MKPPLPWPFAASPFHAGEQAIQELLGVRARIETAGRHLIRDFLLDEHREFFAQLPFLVVGTVDFDGQPWASILTGPPGFVSSPDVKTLRVVARPLGGDRSIASLKVGSDIGVLGIEFATRRRNRVNGTICALRADGFEIAVTQSYGNCPKYIQMRDWETAQAGGDDKTELTEADRLGMTERLMVETADTFFIASAFDQSGNDISHGADASHRGGEPGFVRIEDERTLTVPDFVGNYAFNTLGNLLLAPRCGLLFLDFATGTTLDIAARAEIVWDGSEVESFAGAQRLIRFHITKVRRAERAVALCWRSRPRSSGVQNPLAAPR
jgi:uncharacterized protein